MINHPWFDNLDKKALMNKEIEPEFKPKLSNNVLDVSNFDKMLT